jgi:hypothetical protein
VSDTRRVLAVAEGATLDHGGDRLLQLVGMLRRGGVRVEVVLPALGDDVAQFQRVAPTRVVYGLRPRSLRAALASRGESRPVIGSRALRSWLARRDGAAVLALDPAPHAILRHLPPSVGPVIGVAADPWTPVPLRSTGATSPALDGWVVFDRAQRRVSAHEQTPMCVVPALPPAGPAVEVRRPSPGDGVVVLLVAPDQWSALDHAIEVAWQLARRLPEQPIRWVGHGAERWLTDHDLRHAGLTDRVEVRETADPEALDGAGVVVRTGYGATSARALVGAALAGVPVVSFASEDLPLAVPAHPPFDVEALVDRVVALAADPSTAAEVGRSMAEGVRSAPLQEPFDRVCEILRL